MESKGFTTIPDWMLAYDIDVYETIILAVIYGFSQDGETRFTGSLNYLATKAKCSRRKVINCLDNLMSKELIQKFDVNVRGIHLCEYSFKGSACGALGMNEMHGGSTPGAPNNIEYNIDINNTLSNKGTSKFKKPSVEEVRAYCNERNNGIDPERFFNFYESKGWMVGKTRMKDWKACVRTWEQRTPETRTTPRTPQPRESTFEHNLKVYDQMFGTDFHSQAYGNKATKEDFDEQ